MAFAQNALRALARLDDRVLGRWLDRRPPLRRVIAVSVVAVAVGVLVFVLTGNFAFLGGPLIGVASTWIMRIILPPRR